MFPLIGPFLGAQCRRCSVGKRPGGVLFGLQRGLVMLTATIASAWLSSDNWLRFAKCNLSSVTERNRSARVKTTKRSQFASWRAMTSYRQIEANRRNALKSTGPRTEAGKSAMSDLIRRRNSG
jgi:hypothetical protein